MHTCPKCRTRFRGTYCPFCGAEYGVKRSRRSGGVLGGIFRFIGTLLLVALVLAVLLIALDCTNYAHNPDHSTAYAIIESVRNSIPADALAAYDEIKAQAFEVWQRFLERFVDA